MKQWFCVRTNSKCEQRAADGLKRKGFEIYLPMAKRRVHAKGKTEKTYPLFPRYLFVDPLNLGFYEIKITDGVECLLSNNGIPIPLPSRALADIQALERLGYFDETTEVLRLKEGDKVRLAEGPLKDFVAVLKNASSKRRVEVLLTMFGRPTPYFVPLHALRPA